MSAIKLVCKRDGRKVAFNEKKILASIKATAAEVKGVDKSQIEAINKTVLDRVYESVNGSDSITSQQIYIHLVQVLMELETQDLATAYMAYRQRRTKLKNGTKVRKHLRGKSNSTDINLLVSPESKAEYHGWDKVRIAQALVTESGLDRTEAEDIAATVERRIFKSGMAHISTALIRELVDNELFERGHQKNLQKQRVIGLPKHDIEELIFSKSLENSNIATNNPEAIQHAISETILKQYALQEVFSDEVANAHREGLYHLHDLGYITRVYCSSHSVEYIKKYGLRLDNLDSYSAPAKHARSLTTQLNTFLSSMQAYYAGALGVAHINIMYAPLLEGMSDKEMKQEAQHLIFQASQNAFTRGGQVLFTDFNIHTGVPEYLKKIDAIGPNGKYTGRKYGDYVDTAGRFTKALLEVYMEGDGDGHLFAFPKLDFHINHDMFKDPEQLKLFDLACEVSAHNGSTYFVFDRDEVTLSACCRLRTAVDDKYLIEHPESLRFTGFQNVTINLPQCAYRSGGKYDAFRKELDHALNLVIDAHLQKKKFIRRLMSGPSMPLWQVGKLAADGRPYIDLNQCTYIIGLIGLNECVQCLFGKELHEDEEAIIKGLEIISFMYFVAKEAGMRHKIKFSLEESPAESCSRRVAKIDLQNFKQAKDFVRGSIDRDEVYYTNSIHLRPDANVDLITRIREQAKFHDLIESGAIIHAFVGENLPSSKSIRNLVNKTFRLTHAAQLTISPEFTICRKCGCMSVGLADVCKKCGSSNLAMTREDPESIRAKNWDLQSLLALKSTV